MARRIGLILLLTSVSLLPAAPLAAAHPAAAPLSRPQGGGTVSPCTEAELHNKLGGGGTVTFNCGGPTPIFLNATQTITQDTTVDGSGGVTLDGNGSVTIFVVTGTATVHLKNITLNQGYSGSDGGAIKNFATLYLDNTTIQSSRTDSNHSGGAIFSKGPLFISNSLFQDNQAGSAGALFANFDKAIVSISNTTFRHNQAINSTFGYGGAIWVGEQAQVSISGGTLISNSAKSGGGVYLSSNGVLTVTAGSTPAAITGNTASLSGGGLYSSSGQVTLTDARLSGNLAPGYGGGMRNDGGQVTLTNATLSGNSAGAGGGLANQQASGRASLTHVTLSGNMATFGGGAIYNDHAAALLANVIISGNIVTNTFSTATYGGGIENFGTLTLTNSTVSGNTATNNSVFNSFGGGLYNNQASAAISGSTFSGNSAYNGAGILNVGTLTLVNSTLSDNVATDLGGGFENYEGTAWLTNDTLSNNSASNPGGGVYESGAAPTETITMTSSLIANGLSGGNCTEANSTAGFITSAGYNLSSDSTCALRFTATGDFNDQALNLGPLANNGGPTFTRLPNLPSPAIDVIPGGANGCGTTITTDQRGAPRPFNHQCDIGAVEAGWPYPRLWLPLIRR